jgi:MFS family permease
VAARTLCFSALGVITQLYLSELGAPRFWIGMSSTIAWAAIMLFSHLWGTLSDVLLGRKTVILIATIGSTVMSLLLVVSRSVPVALIGRFLTAALGAGVAPAAMALLSERGGTGARGRRLSIFTTSQAIGFFSGSVLGGLLSTVLDLRYAFLVITGISSLAAFSAYLVPADEEVPRLSEADWRSVLKKMLPSLGALHKDGEISGYGLTSLYIGVVLRKGAIIGIYSLLMVFLHEKRSLTPFVSGSLSALNPGAQAVLMPFWGRAADRYSRKRVFLIGYALCVLVPLMMLFSNTIWLLIAAFLILGVAFAAFISGVTTFIGDVAPPDREGELMGLLKVSQGLGGIIGPAIAGIVSAPTVGDYDGMFITMAAMILIGLIITAVGTRESRGVTSRPTDRSPASSP